MTRVEISIRSGVILSREALARHPESRSSGASSWVAKLWRVILSREATKGSLSIQGCCHRRCRARPGSSRLIRVVRSL